MSLKERLRGVVAAVATAALAISVAPVTALAGAAPLEPGNATVTGVDGAEKVELYKVASVANDEFNMLKTTLEDGFSFDVKDYIDNNAEVANEIAKQLPAGAEATYTAPGSDGCTLEGGVATFSGIDAGLYLVKVTPEESGWSYQTMILSVVPQDANNDGVWDTPTGTVELKKNTDFVNTSLSKWVSDQDLAIDSDEWQKSVDTLGNKDIAYFKVSVQLPTYNGLTADSDIYFDLIDDLPAELDLDGDTDALYINVEEVSLHGGVYVQTVDGHDQIKVHLNAQDLMSVKEGDVLTLTYQAKVAGYSLLGEYTNVAYVEWFKHATDAASQKTDEVEASVITYGAEVTKVVGQLNDEEAVVGSPDSQTLNGAVFKLEKQQADGTWEIVQNNMAADPTTSTVKSLGAGKYRWVELQAPAGYQLNKEELEFEIGDGDEVDYVDAQYFGDLEDTTGAANLPQTGGPGTIALTVVGAGLVAGAAYLVMRSRKEN